MLTIWPISLLAGRLGSFEVREKLENIKFRSWIIVVIFFNQRKFSSLFISLFIIVINYVLVLPVRWVGGSWEGIVVKMEEDMLV